MNTFWTTMARIFVNVFCVGLFSGLACGMKSQDARHLFAILAGAQLINMQLQDSAFGIQLAIRERNNGGISR